MRPLSTENSKTGESQTDTAPLNPEVIVRLKRELGVQLVPLMRLFLEKMPERRQLIEAAYDSGDADALAKAAHKLKGSLSYIGADSMIEAAQKLVHHGRAGEVRQSAHVMEQLWEEEARVIAVLKEMLGDDRLD